MRSVLFELSGLSAEVVAKFRWYGTGYWGETLVLRHLDGSVTLCKQGPTASVGDWVQCRGEGYFQKKGEQS